MIVTSLHNGISGQTLFTSSSTELERVIKAVDELVKLILGIKIDGLVFKICSKSKIVVVPEEVLGDSICRKLGWRRVDESSRMMGKLWMTFHNDSKEASKAISVKLVDKILVLGSRLEDILGVQRVIQNGIPSVNAGKKLAREIMLLSHSIKTTSETHGRGGSRTEAEV